MRKHPAAFVPYPAARDCGLNGVAREDAQQPIVARIDRAYIDIRQASMTFEQNRAATL